MVGTVDVTCSSNLLPDGEIMTLAILYRHGHTTMICCGCTEILAEQGMVEIVGKKQMPGPGIKEKCMTVTFAIAPGFTLAECQAAIKGRHTGEAWGS
jgi:hypothetical protein